MLLSLVHWRLESDADGIGWLCFDRQDAGANTLSAETMAELETCLDTLETSALKGLVIHSGKARGFIAGADINEFPALDSEARAYAVTRQGQHILARLEALPFPSVAVLNGFALGGGLELALACTRRLAIAGSEPVFGLPEVQLGVHPGFGGTVRLTRLIGVRQAMDLMLTGRSIRPAQALKRWSGRCRGRSESNWRDSRHAAAQRGRSQRLRHHGSTGCSALPCCDRAWRARCVTRSAQRRRPHTTLPRMH